MGLSPVAVYNICRTENSYAQNADKKWLIQKSYSVISYWKIALIPFHLVNIIKYNCKDKLYLEAYVLKLPCVYQKKSLHGGFYGASQGWNVSASSFMYSRCHQLLFFFIKLCFYLVFRLAPMSRLTNSDLMLRMEEYKRQNASNSMSCILYISYINICQYTFVYYF